MTLEFEAAVARFDADLIIAATGSPAALRTNRLRRRALAVYRNALDFAAGRPHDPRWGILSLIVDEFIARVGNESRTPDAEAALERLKLLREQEIPARNRAPNLLQTTPRVKIAQIDGRKTKALQQVSDGAFRSRVIAGDEEYAL